MLLSKGFRNPKILNFQGMFWGVLEFTSILLNFGLNRWIAWMPLGAAFIIKDQLSDNLWGI